MVARNHEPCIRSDQGRTNPFAAAMVDKTAMQLFCQNSLIICYYHFCCFSVSLHFVIAIILFDELQNCLFTTISS